MSSQPGEKLSRRDNVHWCPFTVLRRRGLKELLLSLPATLVGFPPPHPRRKPDSQLNFLLSCPRLPAFLPHSGGSRGVRGWPLAPSSLLSQSPQSSLACSHGAQGLSQPQGFSFESKSSFPWSHQTVREIISRPGSTRSDVTELWTSPEGRDEDEK